MTAKLVRLALMASLAGGCVVPQTRYDEARSALAVEQEAHRRTNGQLHAIAQKVEALERALQEREREIAERSREAAEKDFAANVAVREREAADQVVEQLRGELGRVGDHLRAFAQEKQQIAQALDRAEERAQRLEAFEKTAGRSTLAVRDLSLLLGEPITTGEVELAIVDARPVLRIEHPSAFVSGSGDLQPGTRSVASAVARAARLHPELRIRIFRRAADEAAATLELEKVADQLESEGVPAARIEIAVEKADASSGDGPLEIQLI